MRARSHTDERIRPNLNFKPIKSLIMDRGHLRTLIKQRLQINGFYNFGKQTKD